MERPVNHVWSGEGGTFNPWHQTYQNERNNQWQYDADGNLIDSGSVQYTIDAAGQANRVVSLTMIPYNGNPYSTIWGITSDQTQSFDGDGAVVKKVVAETTHDNANGDDTTTATSYLVRSSVLVGKVVTEINSETGQRGFVYLGNEVLAWQMKAGTTEYVKWEHRDPQNASFRMTGSNGAIDGSERAELDPLSTNAGISDPTTVPSLKKLSLYPGFGEAAMAGDTECNIDGILQPCTRQIQAAINRGDLQVQSIIGSVSQCEARRVDDATDTSDKPEDPSNPNNPVTINERYHYELVYTGVVNTSFQQRQPQNTYDPRADFRDYGRQLLNNGADNDCLKLALLVYKAGQIWGDQGAGGIIDGLLSQLTEITSTTYGRRNASDPNFRVGVEGPGRTFGYSGFKREFQDQESPNQVRHFIAYLALGYTEPVRLGADGIAYLRDPNNQPDRDLGYVGNRLGNEFRGDYERLAQDIWYEVCGQSTSALDLK